MQYMRMKNGFRLPQREIFHLQKPATEQPKDWFSKLEEQLSKKEKKDTEAHKESTEEEEEAQADKRESSNSSFRFQISREYSI